ncbi:hypothetical protein H4W33_004232 [Kibdelosporangium phytohabitans]|nr:hypothetical protein [Kibdelosporangium phytohabitans]
MGVRDRRVFLRGRRLDRLQYEDGRAGVHGTHHGDLATRSPRAPSSAGIGLPLGRQSVHVQSCKQSIALQWLTASIESVGDAHENALAESTVGLFMTEVVGRPVHHPRRGRVHAPEWADWYNNVHLGHLPPVEREALTNHRADWRWFYPEPRPNACRCISLSR